MYLSIMYEKHWGQVPVKYAPHLTGFTLLNAVFDSPPSKDLTG